MATNLSGGGGSEFGGETERFHDGQVSFDRAHGSSLNLGIFEHVTSLPVQHAVNTSDGLEGKYKELQISWAFPVKGFGYGEKVKG